jgi:hypothetical protein
VAEEGPVVLVLLAHLVLRIPAVVAEVHGLLLVAALAVPA